MIRAVFHTIIFALLTVLTQIGGVAYLLALWLTRGFWRRKLAFVVLYAGASVASVFVAPLFGRVSLPCFGGNLEPRTLLSCALNRQYVTPELALLTRNLARDMDAAHPGTTTQYLDASFPYGTGFPLLPHLSHDDGRKLDFAFYYERDGAYRPGETPSPLGYWGFLEPHADDPETCRDGSRLTLRWDMGWFQRFVRTDLTMETRRTAAMLRWLADEAVKGGIEKILLEPHLRRRFALPPKVVRFQGCRAARHDDHVHIQVR